MNTTAMNETQAQRVVAALLEESAATTWPEGPDNSDRARWALNAVAAYAIQNRGGSEAAVSEDDPEHLDEVVGDLLCDLMHVVGGAGLDFDAIVERGRINYEAEAQEAAG